MGNDLKFLASVLFVEFFCMTSLFYLDGNLGAVNNRSSKLI